MPQKIQVILTFDRDPDSFYEKQSPEALADAIMESIDMLAWLCESKFDAKVEYIEVSDAPKT